MTQPVPQGGFAYEAVIGANGRVRAERRPWSVDARFALSPVLDASALEALKEAPETLADEIPPELLALPETLDRRILDLAAQLTAGRNSFAGRVEAIGRHLSAFTYDASMESASGDPLAEFLFQRRRGHCELFAAAMAVLLRASGVPARTVGGFYGGTRGPEGDYVVRLSAAHAWVEIFVPGVGFVAIDPTPQDGRAPQASGFVTWLSDRHDELSELWRRAVVDLSFWDQWQAIRRFRRSASGVSAAAPAGQGRSPSSSADFSVWRGRLSSWAGGAALPASILLASLIFAAAVWCVRRAALRRAHPGLSGPSGRLYSRLLKALRRRGFRTNARSLSAPAL